jgi:glycosyltransferase involved in cell wall biosynthesis
VRISVVIPTYNEAQSIGRVLADIPGMVQEVLVVDSDSSDGTAGIAQKMGAKVLREPRRGYGRACLTGLAAVNAPDVVVFLDGDYSDRPAEMPLLLDPLRAGSADMVIGSRLAGARTPGALPWHAVFGNRLAAALITSFSGVHLTDLGPFRAVRYDALIALGLQEATYGWPVEMIVKGARRGLRIVEVPVSYHARLGKSKISGTFRGSVGAAWGILSAIVKYQFLDATSSRDGAV